MIYIHEYVAIFMHLISLHYKAQPLEYELFHYYRNNNQLIVFFSHHIIKLFYNNENELKTGCNFQIYSAVIKEIEPILL